MFLIYYAVWVQIIDKLNTLQAVVFRYLYKHRSLNFAQPRNVDALPIK